MPQAPVAPDSPFAIRSPEQLEALRETTLAARALLPSLLGTSPGRRLDEVNFVRLARSLDWLDSLRTSLAVTGGKPVAVERAEAVDLWTVADAAKCLYPQLKALLRARDARDAAGIERWAGHASVSVGLLAVALRVEVPR